MEDAERSSNDKYQAELQLEKLETFEMSDMK